MSYYLLSIVNSKCVVTFKCHSFTPVLASAMHMMTWQVVRWKDRGGKNEGSLIWTAGDWRKLQKIWLRHKRRKREAIAQNAYGWRDTPMRLRWMTINFTVSKYFSYLSHFENICQRQGTPINIVTKWMITFYH